MNISDLQGHGLAGIEGGFSFADGNHVVLDGAHSTHLSTSLKELEQLKLSAVSVGAHGLTVDLGASFDSVAHDVQLPSFGGAINLAVDQVSELSGNAHLADDLTALAGDHVTSIDLSHLSVEDLTTHTSDLHNLDTTINTCLLYTSPSPRD